MKKCSKGVSDLILGIETETLEFKKSTGELKEAVLSICAILNKHQHGELYFGVKPDGTVIGQVVTEESLREVSQKIKNFIEPKIYPEINKVVVDGRDCIHVKFEGNQVPYFAYGVAKIRVADEDLTMSPEQITELLLRSGREGNRWESLVSNKTIDDIDEELLKKYDRVILCCGASNPRDIKVPGRDAKGIYFAVDFLKKVTKTLLDSDFTKAPYEEARGKHVLVIGGGDTGNDCVGTSVRLGAKSVTQLEMMPMPPTERAASNPWPEWPKVLKTDYGQEEAIAVFGHDPRVYQTTVTDFIKDKNGNVCQARIVKLKSEKDAKTGRMMMVPVEGTEEVIPADLVLIAAGFLGSQKYVTDAFKVATTARTNVETKPEAYETSVPRVFTAGDMHRGQSLVVWAIREGREAAKAVDESLMGYSYL